MADTGKTIGLIKALASVDPTVIQSSVEGWLDDHPEATTTVQDGSITKAKLDSSLQETVDDVGDLKTAIVKIDNVLPLDYGSAFANKTINGSNDVTDSSTRLLSDVFVPIEGQTFEISEGYEFRYAIITANDDAGLGSWVTSLTITSYMVSTAALGMRINVRNANDTSADISPSEIAYETDIPEFINYAQTASKEYVDAKSSTDEHLKNKKVVFYGDSVTGQNRYVPIVAQYYGINAVNAGVSGSRISYNSDTDMSSNTRISALPSDADIVVIMGGTNDWDKIEIEQTLTYNDGFDRTKFKGGLAYIIQHIQEQCPNAMLIVATLIGGRNETRQEGETEVTQYLPEADRYGQTDLDFRNAEIEVANLLNIRVCDTWSCGINGNNADTMIADTVHPTEAGAKLIAEYMIGYMKTIIIE